MCLVWAALSSVLTCRAINWLMEYIRCSAGVASEEKAGGMRGPGSGAAVTGCPQRMQLAGVGGFGANEHIREQKNGF